MLQPNWIFTHDQFMKPCYRVSPFSTTDIALNSQLPRSNYIDVWFDENFSAYNPFWTLKARDGITLALESLKLTPQSVVTIITSSQNKYISGCVTKAIEKICNWNREITDDTCAILLIHEFGKTIKNSERYYQLNLPIIEDFAHGFLMRPPIKHQADFVIYSFPKYFPIQYGGILLTKNKLHSDYKLDNETLDYIKKVLSSHIAHIDEYRQERLSNQKYLSEKFLELGCSNHFSWQDDETPSVFMFAPPKGVDLIALKEFMQQQGIESSVFYGEHAFFIPLHHRLKTVDLDYFITAYSNFLIARE